MAGHSTRGYGVQTDGCCGTVTVQLINFIVPCTALSRRLFSSK